MLGVGGVRENICDWSPTFGDLGVYAKFWNCGSLLSCNVAFWFPTMRVGLQLHTGTMFGLAKGLSVLKLAIL
jgi:hypothetical protein